MTSASRHVRVTPVDAGQRLDAQSEESEESEHRDEREVVGVRGVTASGQDRVNLEMAQAERR